ncbi:hypothetical protein [Streptomyces atriruber]|uniref:hypothetical protein n=1 Tax=Streptomyces atriruber TaxID=545121 RepID=UPI0006E42C24|nr:hypothetical protein [Streptomyces atriruber]
MSDRERHEFIEQHPRPTNPVEALAHTLQLFEELDDDRLLVQATSGMYGKGERTGLTMGDLREIAGMLKRWAGDDA